MSRTDVVVSDLEGTLTTGETWKGVGRYLVAHGHGAAYRRFFLRRVPTWTLTKFGVLDRGRFRDDWMRDLLQLLKGLTIEETENAAEWVVEHVLWPRRRQDVVAELLKHRAEGRHVILASGTYLPVLQAFADRMGAEALGTPVEFVMGKLTGHLAGPINAGTAKAEQLAFRLNGARLDSAYGDTMPDLAMLEMSANPVAVYPEPSLRQVAAARGWRVLAG